MPKLAPSPLAAALCLVLALGLVSCGEEDAELLPGGTAREITANLDTVQRLADEGDCIGAESAALQVSEQVEALEGVDDRLKRALRQGADRLNEVVARCEEEEPVEAAPVPTEEEPDEEDLEGDEERERDKEEKQKEKEERAKEREEGRQEGEQETDGDEQDEEDGGPAPPPQSEGKGQGNGSRNGPPSEGGGTPSGGVGPANPVDEGG